MTDDALDRTEQPGDRIGRYKLLEKIGEGGFGVVWMAEQQEPVRRQVALKIVKLGLDTKQVVARFDAERQALAMMDHPNIAKVLDGGATETGRPYFVMELVRGIAITKFCDETKLDARERLRLFTQVCRAVQHAHHKGVIHRDIKPSNVLVTLHDDRPVPKVIDFGIAKATSAHLTQHTLFTNFRQMIGTPEYMAPEQCGLSELDIDTRADVYSLGVLLYELLTGTKPFEMRAVLERGYEEVLRHIREVDPPKPSTRVSTLGPSAATVAALRSAQPQQLSKLIRGDLDWIVMKALEKDRTRRYDTANAFAEDVDRYLDDQPVLATPPTTVYRLRKFARRNRALVAGSAAVLAALVLGLATSTYMYARERDVLKTLFNTESERYQLQQRADDLRKEVADLASTRTQLEAQTAAFAAQLEQLKQEVDDRDVQLRAAQTDLAQFKRTSKVEMDKSERTLDALHREAENARLNEPRGLSRWLTSVWQALPNAPDEARALLDGLAARVDDDCRDTPGIQLAVRRSLAECYRELEQFDRAIAMRRAIASAADTNIADSQLDLALALLDQAWNARVTTEERNATATEAVKLLRSMRQGYPAAPVRVANSFTNVGRARVDGALGDALVASVAIARDEPDSAATLAEAETSLLDAWKAFDGGRDLPAAQRASCLRETALRCVRLYDTWDAIQPAAGKARDAQLFRTRLAELEASAK